MNKTTRDDRHLQGIPPLGSTPKPPLGVMPKRFWLEIRQAALIRAVQRSRTAKSNTATKWILEWHWIDNILKQDERNLSRANPNDRVGLAD